MYQNHVFNTNNNDYIAESSTESNVTKFRQSQQFKKGRLGTTATSATKISSSVNVKTINFSENKNYKSLAVPDHSHSSSKGTYSANSFLRNVVTKPTLDSANNNSALHHTSKIQIIDNGVIHGKNNLLNMNKSKTAAQKSL